MGLCSISLQMFSNSWCSFGGGVNDEGVNDNLKIKMYQLTTNTRKKATRANITDQATDFRETIKVIESPA